MFFSVAHVIMFDNRVESVTAAEDKETKTEIGKGLHNPI